MYDVIPDIRGQAEKLKAALRNLGYSEKNGAWRHSDPTCHAIFLGDFIDRGPDNREVIRIVRGMIDAGIASAVMGNHELNAIHFHTRDENGPLRDQSEKNIAQHASFLKEFPLGSTEAGEAIAWMRTLPLFFEFEGFRAVHACWKETNNVRKVFCPMPTATPVLEFSSCSAHRQNRFMASDGSNVF